MDQSISHGGGPAQLAAQLFWLGFLQSQPYWNKIIDLLEMSPNRGHCALSWAISNYIFEPAGTQYVQTIVPEAFRTVLTTHLLGIPQPSATLPTMIRLKCTKSQAPSHFRSATRLTLSSASTSSSYPLVHNPRTWQGVTYRDLAHLIHPPSS